MKGPVLILIKLTHGHHWRILYLIDCNIKYFLLGNCLTNDDCICRNNYIFEQIYHIFEGICRNTSPVKIKVNVQLDEEHLVLKIGIALQNILYLFNYTAYYNYCWFINIKTVSTGSGSHEKTGIYKHHGQMWNLLSNILMNRKLIINPPQFPRNL